MKNLSKLFLAASLIAALTACAGTNFVRPDDSALQTGKTTIAEVREKLSKPYRESEVVKNDENVTVLLYVYASTAGTPAEAGVIPGRSMDFSFWKDTLVSTQFVSSFKDDASNFDASKRNEIVKGKTTRDQVIGLLGRPAGYAIYPLIKEKQAQALVYSYRTTSGSGFNLKFAKRLPIVTIGQDGVVSDVNYESSGMQ